MGDNVGDDDGTSRTPNYLCFCLLVLAHNCIRRAHGPDRAAPKDTPVCGKIFFAPVQGILRLNEVFTYPFGSVLSAALLHYHVAAGISLRAVI